MKRIKRTPAEKARAQYTGYLVKEPMELMDCGQNARCQPYQAKVSVEQTNRAG